MLFLQYLLLSAIFIAAFKPVLLIVISSPSGHLEGLEYETENNRTAYAFLGIRYAQPPLGNLRFRAPVPLPPWTGVYNAKQLRNICIQPDTNRPNMTIGYEDCLFLNLYTTTLPNTTVTSSSLPVVVWIHGGAFTFNSGNLDLHEADRFLEKDILVISINYRLGVFGFLSTEDSVVPGNYGLKDQVLALEWVQKNIAAFGGDPRRVTIFGESAGAVSVHHLRQAKRVKNLFYGAIADSGNTLNPWSTARNTRKLAFRIGLLNGIITFSSKKLVDRLRTVDATQLHISSVAPALVDISDPFNAGLPFSPILEEPSEEAVFTEFSYEVQRDGKFHHGPLLHGFNSKESADVNKVPLFEQYNLFPSRLTPIDINANEEQRNIIGRNIMSYYFHNQSVETQPGLSNYLSDNEFVRGIVKSTVLESPYCSVYLFILSFNDFDGAIPAGVSHAQDQPFLWKWNPPAFNLTPAVRLNVERMVQMWSNFIKTGNPTPILSPEVNVTWPLANATGGDTIHYLDIGEKLVPKINPQKQDMDFWEEQFKTYGHPPYNTY